MPINSTTLRPGLLVSLKTAIKGNVKYTKTTIDAAHIDQGQELERWETLRVVDDPAELDLAKKARGRATSLVRGVCAQSEFGLLCPSDRKDRLDDAIIAARKVAMEFNATATRTQVSVYIVTGVVASDDLEAVRAINSEVRDLLDAMAQGLRDMDVEAIRKAANDARNLGSMLSPDAQERVKVAIDTARSAARSIAKSGDLVAVEVDQLAINKITSQRMAFLDLDGEGDMAAPETTVGRAVEFMPEAAAPVFAPAASDQASLLEF